jgi:mono/diheme cytochrome c family protein
MTKRSSAAISILSGLAMVSGSALAATAPDAGAGTVQPTFYRDVLPVLQQSCQACHRPAGLNMGGLIAPMSLVTFDEVRPWAKSIAKAVESKTMPPWHASEKYHGVFANERTLEPEQIATLVLWAKSGAPAGDPSAAPPPVAWPPAGWAIGEPDLVLEMPETFTVADDVEDQYQNFTIDLPVEEERWIKAIEFRPGSSVVHHIIGYVIEPGATYRDGRGHVGGIAPGNDPESFSAGTGYPVRPGSKFVFAMHYHKEAGAGTAVPDRSIAGIKFYPREEQAQLRTVHIEAIGNGAFEIPPNHENWQVGSARVFDRPIELHYLMPHMHLRGKAAKFTATYPDGAQQVLLEVPRYDFGWQTSYEFRTPLVLPAGTRLDVQLWFENTAERAAANGFSNQKAVRWGGPTTDEMDLGFLSFVYLDDEPAAATAAAASGR